jgi:hypothetical protein
MTIFGFNTDVKHGDTVYHVQSEARRAEFVIQTLVFVKGQCIGKRTVSYADKRSQPEFSDQDVHELLKAQHKTVIDAINEGNLDSVLKANGENHFGTSSLNGKSATAPDDILIEFQITDLGRAIEGAEVVSRAGDSAVLARATSDASGNVKLHIPLTDAVRQASSITVEATYSGKSIIRKFRIKETEQKPR